MKTFCLTNHTVTENQVKELHDVYKCDEIIYPDKDLSLAWSQVKPDKELDMDLIEKVVTWLDSATEGDVFIVQGEFGSTFILVDYALKKGLVPVHAVSQRKVVETKVGETVTKTAIFEHVCYRKYQYYKNTKK